ncbi:DUF4194 domain-containing protein [Xanthomonas axonopodis pv. vasculorum]|uniref:Uncharacterized protein n=2 Tax=Xanthomonas axonopodis TaxID=53413 RepID=A0A098PUN1_9XANT|nr:DUF4194 domain-containing protein [Xanthomonas axonopodis]KGE50426.1 hypothetical protein GW15_0220920 [Xanthomonas axonopodis pv. vasculorum]PPV09222.1 DUF4194 domain-containing protein [Xanthomonas axonopodis pv. vasculorum]QKD88348.1 DUF4194 domain-containing protein [Xanthomonas axonopodis pv. vasculorum]
MNWSEDTRLDADEDTGASATDERMPMTQASSAEPRGELFLGDTGTLPFDARRALCQLLAGPSIDAQRHGALWPALLRNEAAIRQVLCELFLELVLDREGGVAFTRQADTAELESPILLRSAPLTFIESVLLLFLRQQLAEADTRGERAVVDEAQLVEALSVYEKNVSTDRAGFARRVMTAIGKMRDNQLLSRLRGSEERYEVSPVLKLLFSAEDVQALVMAYRGLREGEVALD